MRPLSWTRSRARRRRGRASQLGIGPRRPVAATTTSAGSTVPSSRRTPVTTRRPGRRPARAGDAGRRRRRRVRSSTPGWASDRLGAAPTRGRAPHDEHRQVLVAGLRLAEVGVAGMVVQPAASRASSTSGKRSRSSTTMRARKPWVWCTWGAPRPLGGEAASASPVERQGVALEQRDLVAGPAERRARRPARPRRRRRPRPAPTRFPSTTSPPSPRSAPPTSWQRPLPRDLRYGNGCCQTPLTPTVSRAPMAGTVSRPLGRPPPPTAGPSAARCCSTPRSSCSAPRAGRARRCGRSARRRGSTPGTSTRASTTSTRWWWPSTTARRRAARPSSRPSTAPATTPRPDARRDRGTSRSSTRTAAGPGSSTSRRSATRRSTGAASRRATTLVASSSSTPSTATAASRGEQIGRIAAAVLVGGLQRAVWWPGSTGASTSPATARRRRHRAVPGLGDTAAAIAGRAGRGGAPVARRIRRRWWAATGASRGVHDGRGRGRGGYGARASVRGARAPVSVWTEAGRTGCSSW